MPDFQYEAFNQAGKKDSGTLTANSPREAAMMLDTRGLFPTKITPLKTRGSQTRGGGKVSPRVIGAFYSQLADLLQSGVPLLKSLELLERQTKNVKLGFALREVKTMVADGTTLSDSMSKFPRTFDELSISMVRAGQEGGFLEDVLRRIANFLEHQEDLKAKIVGSMTYPVLLFVIGSGILFALIVFFVPNFEPIFEKLKAKGELPWLTTALLGLSHFIIDNIWWLWIFPVGAIAGFISWRASPKGRRQYDLIKIKIPVMGKLVLSLALGRFTRILGTLLANGIPILRSLEIAKDSTGNKILAHAIEQSAENVTSGQKLADPLRRNKYFPNDVVEMIAVAEESNTLEKVLVDIANSLEKRSARQLELFVKLLEPLMLLVMASTTLVVVLGLLMPIFRLSKALN